MKPDPTPTPPQTSRTKHAATAAMPAQAPAVPAPVQPRRRPRLRLGRFAPYFFISPFFVIFVVFGLFPLLFSIYLSFHRWEPAAGLEAMNWVGLENYVYVVLNDDWFH